jgi:phosphoenolpyruvate carboxylase
MANKTMIYLLVLIVLFFLITDVITLMFRGPNFTVEYYNSDVLVGYTDVATITTVSGLKFKSEKKKEEYLTTYEQTSLETFKKYFSEVSKDIGKKIEVLDFKSNIKNNASILEITETVVLKGIVQPKNDAYIFDMGQIRMNSVANSTFKVHLPEDVRIESVEPTPTKNLGTLILWSGEDIKTFPRIVYKR